MKYSFMSFSTPELSLGAMLEVAREYGYDGIEPRIDAGHAHGIEVSASASERRALGRTAAASGVSLACLATSLRYADPAEADSVVAATHKRIDLAADLGIPVMRVFGGMLAAGLSREQAVDVVASALEATADHAGERGVCLALETHDDWCNPADVAAVMAAVDHPAVGVNWDVMHPGRTGHATIDEAFACLRPWIRHLHIHDGVGEAGELVPIGEGEHDHHRVIELLLQVGYAGFLSGEWIMWEAPEVHLPRELATLKRYERGE